MKTKPTRVYSAPLMKQNIKSNGILTVVISLILCLMTVVVSYATNMIGGGQASTEAQQEAQTELYSHLFALAAYNQMTGGNLSVADFMAAEDRTMYDLLFSRMSQQSAEATFSSEKLAECIAVLQDKDGSLDSYIEQFEYAYVLSRENGVFSGNELTMDGMLKTMLTAMGLPADRLTKMAEMDKTAMLNTMYFTVMGLLPVFLYIVIVGNSLIVNQVDSGSMAYVLATPTKRSAVANTQALFLIVSTLLVCTMGCVARCVALNTFVGEVDIAVNVALYAGMYLLSQAIGGICYMGSCLFTQSRKAIAFGGGVAVWCFIASLLGMFGAEDMVNMGMGVEELGIFNKLTLVGLYDVKAISTLGTDAVDSAFIWKLCVLAGVAVVTYAIGKVGFQKKDLPL